MKHLKTLHEKDVFPGKITDPNIIYSDRLTGKAIVFDMDNNIALVGNKQNEFLLLPGGGINEGEDIKVGVVRECLEEIGCDVSILKEVGYVDDYRPRDKTHCITHCYTAKLLGQKGNPKYDEGEIKIGMYIKWLPLDEAHKVFKAQEDLLKSGKVTFYNTGFNIVRDLLFVEEVKTP